MREPSPDESTGPDGLRTRVLRELTDVLKGPFSNILGRSRRPGKVPNDWRKANFAHNFKKDQKNNLGNCRRVGLTLDPGKPITVII